VTDELGMKMEKVELSALGSAKKITVTKVRGMVVQGSTKAVWYSFCNTGQ
jgi:hypothetical protein